MANVSNASAQEALPAARRVAAVSGGIGGLGTAICIALARAGRSVVALDLAREQEPGAKRHGPAPAGPEHPGVRHVFLPRLARCATLTACRAGRQAA